MVDINIGKTFPKEQAKNTHYLASCKKSHRKKTEKN